MRERQDAQLWDEVYSPGNDESIWGPPCEIYTQIAEAAGNGTVLDLGCGDGRHALYFAQRGFEVTAIDISIMAITKLRDRAARSGLKIQTQVADLATFGIEMRYNVVIVHGVLHLLPRSTASEVICTIKRQTCLGGFNALVTMTNVVHLHDSYSADERFPNGELYRNYSDWRVLVDEAYSLPADRFVAHRRHFNRVVAQRSHSDVES